MLQNLKMENSQMADELDVARDKALKLAKVGHRLFSKWVVCNGFNAYVIQSKCTEDDNF